MRGLGCLCRRSSAHHTQHFRLSVVKDSLGMNCTPGMKANSFAAGVSGSMDHGSRLAYRAFLHLSDHSSLFIGLSPPPPPSPPNTHCIHTRPRFLCRQFASTLDGMDSPLPDPMLLVPTTQVNQPSSRRGTPESPSLPASAPARTLVEVLTQYTPIQDHVLGHLEISDVLVLTKTTQAFRDFYNIVERTQFDINKALSPFFTSPIKFRSLQAKYNILIGSLFALHFMSRGRINGIKHAALDIIDVLCMQKGGHLTALSSFLSDGRYVKRNSATDSPEASISFLVSQVQTNTLAPVIKMGTEEWQSSPKDNCSL